MGWTDQLKGDPFPWLLEMENPPVHYWTLLDLLDRSREDGEVRAARTAIPGFAPLAELLGSQKSAGNWVKRDYYLPKAYGTFWVLIVLGDAGLTAEHEAVRRACAFLFTFQREHGGFCRRRRVSGRGLVWDDQPEPCTHARILRFLFQFGYGDDPRARAATDWLLVNQRDDGMWHCGRPSQPGCLRATLDYLRAAVLDVELAAHPATDRAAAAVVDLLMEPRMARYHSDELWTVLTYPYFGYSVISALDALGRCGYGLDHPKVALAMGHLLDRQGLDGRWPLDRLYPRAPFDFGPVGVPNKWLTLDALRVARLFFDRDV